ncbi:MAG TPA: hypothetical protein VLL57_07105 [Candidatus Binataceae bacterium]|nr:hypothetical protein [Candidatus Binataceae bacterium]
MALDEAKFRALADKIMGELGAVMSAPLVVIGDRLGLYKALAEQPATPGELAERTNTFERYVREWLAAQAASGFVSYDAAAGRYFMTEEQAMAFCNELSPVFAPGAFELISALVRDEPKIADFFSFRARCGMGGARCLPVPRHRALLPSELCGESHEQLDSRAPGSRRKT